MAHFPARLPSATAARQRLRELLAGEVPLELPGPYDAVCAQVLAKIGFQAFWAGGYVGSATRMGVGDINLMTLPEQLAFCTSLVDATGLPVVADADNGYGEALQVARTAQAFERAGVSAIVIEDQASPKHCAFYAGMPLKVISRQEMVAKISAAVAARNDESMMILARTDALPALHDPAEALARAQACVDAGADGVFTPSSSLDDLRFIGHRWGRPQPLIMSSFNFPQLTLDGVKELGYSARLHPLPGILAALKAVQVVYTSLYETGTFGDTIKGSMPMSEFEELLGVPVAEDLDKQYRETSGV